MRRIEGQHPRRNAPHAAMASLPEKSHAQTLLPVAALLDWLSACLLEEGPTRTIVREKAPLRATTSLQEKVTCANFAASLCSF